MSVFIRLKAVDDINLKNKQDVAKVIFSHFENRYDDLIIGSKEILTDWSNEIMASNKLSKDSCSNSIINLIDKNDLYITYGIGDLEGNIICSKTEFPKDYNLNNVTSKYSELLSEKEFEVTSFGLSTTTKEPRIAVGYPVLNKNGEVIGGVFLSIRLEAINNDITKMSLPVNSELLITDNTGAILVNSPENKDKLGTKRFSPTTFSLILSKQEGVIDLKEENGKQMVYAYAPFYLNNHRDFASFIIYGIEKDKSILELPNTTSGMLLIMLASTVIIQGTIVAIFYKRHTEIFKDKQN